MPSPGTHVFVTSLSAGAEGAMVRAEPLPPLLVGSPPELGGMAGTWSPEHLLLASLSSCYYTTLSALATHAGIAVRSLSCRATGTVEKTAAAGNGEKMLAFTKIHLAVDVDVDPVAFAAVHGLLQKAESQCLVSQSLRIPVAVDAIVTMNDRSPGNVAGAM